jgi:para-aminobenzoate synthetase
VQPIVLVDNYDSFTYNLAQLLARVAGVPPVVVRNDELPAAEILRLDPAAIVLSPGPGRPQVARDVGVCAELATQPHVPVLGVCLGFQVLVHTSGGEVAQLPPVHGRTSPVRHTGAELFGGLPQDFDAVRYHSLGAVGRLPDELELTAWTADGLPMAVRHRSRRAWGVQFHPESVATEHGDRLLANWLRLAGPAPVRLASPPTRPVEQPATPARVHHRRLATYVDPEDVFVSLYGGAPTAFWLDSSLAEPGAGRFSFLGAARDGGTELTYDVTERCVTIRRGDDVVRRREPVLDTLQAELGRVRAAAPELDVPFVGGFVGYLGYEVKADCGGSAAHRYALPDAHWLLADRVLAFDHGRRAIYAIALAHDGDDDGCRTWLDAVENHVAGVTPAPPVGAAPEGDVALRLERAREDYTAAVETCLEAIRAGESYELCLTTQARTGPLAAPLDAYRVLRATSPAPYSAFLRFGDTAVLCSSPERFLRVEGDGAVTSKPIKGTAPRHADPLADARSRENLRRSEKERSENLMIVDLLRNDLGRVCETGSVEVPSLMAIESYATVHQLVSTVQGRLRTGLGAVDCLRAAFPGGSMTGAPKLRSMELLDRIETGARGIYSGTLGYLSADGCADLNIVIRTAVTTPAGTTVGLGGAVVALSDPDREYDEVLLKGQGLQRALRAWRDGAPEEALAAPAGG